MKVIKKKAAYQPSAAQNPLKGSTISLQRATTVALTLRERGPQDPT